MSKETLNSWDKRFFQVCGLVATWSEDRTTQVGAVLVGPANEILTTGYNGFPRGVNQEIDSRHTREGNEKYRWTEHAERNAIFNLARVGGKSLGAKIYSTYHPCSDCARSIIQSGVVEVNYIVNKEFEQRMESCSIAAKMFSEANLKVRIFNRPAFLDEKHLLAGVNSDV